MKFFALVALFALATETQAISITQLAEPEAKPAPAPKAPEKKKEKAPKEEKATDVAKQTDEKEEAAKGAAEATANKDDAAVEAGLNKANAKDEPRERTAAEKTRDHILNVARTGQEAIEANEKNNAEIAAKWAAQDKAWAAADSAGTSGSVRAKNQDAEQKRRDAETVANAKNTHSPAESWTANLDKNEAVIGGENKAPILQSTSTLSQKK